MMKPQQILVTHDFSNCSLQALDYGIEFAVMNRAALHFLYVETLHNDVKILGDEHKTKAQVLRENLRTAIWESMERQGYKHTDLDLLTYSVLHEVAAAPAIVRYCDEYRIDLVVMGTHGRHGLKRQLLGSVTEEVVRLAPCAVFTVREQIDFKPLEEAVSTIGVPIDFSDHSFSALAHAKELADTLEARLEIVHVIEERLHPAFYNTGVFSVYDIEPDIETRVLNELKQLVKSVEGPVCETQFTVLKGHPVRELLAWIESKKSDLVVLATHGLTGLERVILGSVAERIVRESPCPVFIVKHDQRVKNLQETYIQTQSVHDA